MLSKVGGIGQRTSDKGHNYNISHKHGLIHKTGLPPENTCKFVHEHCLKKKITRKFHLTKIM